MPYQVTGPLSEVIPRSVRPGDPRVFLLPLSSGPNPEPESGWGPIF